MEPTMSRAEQLMKQALTDPQDALVHGRQILAGLPESESGERSEILRALSMAARHANRIDESIDFARKAAEGGEEAGEEELQLLGLLTMSGSLAIAGRMSEALEFVEEGVAAATDPHLKARFVFQRAAILANVGSVANAVKSFRQVLPVFRKMEDGFSVGQTLNRLGLLYTSLGRLPEAEEHLTEALSLTLEREEYVSAHGIQHNLGMLAAYRGDIPAALEWLEKSDLLFMEVSGADAPQHVARCEVLIGVGRFEEALGLALQIAGASRRRGDGEHEANALLVAAQAALLVGDHSQAVSLGTRAAALFGDVTESPRAIEAMRVVTEARFHSEGASVSLLGEAMDLVRVLESEGQLVAANLARFLVGRIALVLGDQQRVEQYLAPVSEVDSGPVELRLQARLARALRRLSEGDSRGAAAAARSGLVLIDKYQGVLGATDLRLGLERHGAELGEIGLGLALDSGRPRRILEWMERTRARALRHRPVTPEVDNDVRDLLGRLRQVEAELRKPENRGDSRLDRERRLLQERIQTADRLKRSRAESDRSLDTDTLIGSLDHRTLLELAIHDEQLFGVAVSKGRAWQVDLGEAEPILRELAQVRFGMRRAARRGRGIDAGLLEALDRMLLGEIELGEGEVIVVPPPPLMMTPWSALPSLHGRTLTVVPSAEMWWWSKRAESVGDGVVVAGGPDLVTADSEVREIAHLYEDARVLPPGSTVQEVRDAIGSSSLAHIACHATFQVDNPMFSSLRLGDGDLNVYEIERLKDPPALVVLSACDSGYTEARAGDELAGLTSALLSMGTRSIVASVGLVPDAPATSELMVEFHRGLVGGLEPAAALARAQEAKFDDPDGFVAAASFICVGA